MTGKKTLFTTHKQKLYQDAVEEIKDVRGLSLLRNIMEKYNLSFVTIDFKLNITVRRNQLYNPKKEKE